MVKNTTGGNKHKKGKNSNFKKNRQITYADNNETLYALVISPLGDSKFNIHCSDMVDRIGIIRGALHKSTFINPGDVVLLSLREFEKVKNGSKERCDILLKYLSHEIDQIKKQGMFYKNTNKTFNTVLENGKIQFNNNEEDKDAVRMTDLPPSESEEESDDEDTMLIKDRKDYEETIMSENKNVDDTMINNDFYGDQDDIKHKVKDIVIPNNDDFFSDTEESDVESDVE
jgi:translation initiation factor 1A